jgi:hypothetical protein
VLQLSAAARDFGFNDADKDRLLAGYTMAAFFVVGAPAALVVSGRRRSSHAACRPWQPARPQRRAAWGHG